MKAIISGAGIGGLAAAAALAMRGWDVCVYERQREIRAIGAGIYIWENGIRILTALNAYESTMRDAFHGRVFERRDGTGRVLSTDVLPPDLRLVSIPRQKMMDGLRQAAIGAGATIQTGAEVVGADADGSLFFANGDRIRGDLAIGADGVWSPVRRALGVELVHERTPEGALRTIIPGTQDDLRPDERGRYIEIFQGSRRLIITPVSQSQIYLALTCLQSDEDARQLSIHACWRKAFGQWAHLIDRISGEVSWGVYSIVKVRSWSAGRACVLGDAAHAQPPNLGQGGGMAMQSALALAVHLEGVRDRRDIPEALGAWEAHCRPLVDRCQSLSCLYGEVTSLPDDIRALVVSNILSHPWFGEQIAAPATSAPLGTTA